MSEKQYQKVPDDDPEIGEVSNSESNPGAKLHPMYPSFKPYCNAWIDIPICLVLALSLIFYLILCTHLPQTITTIFDNPDHPFLVGLGKADITPPPYSFNLMGYASPTQQGTGLKQRLYARAFVIASAKSPDTRIVYTILDLQSGDTAVRRGILEGLAEHGLDKMYGTQNVAVTGTHSHAGPGGWMNYLLPQITNRGFSRESYDAVVSGAVKAILQANRSMRPCQISMKEATLTDASINRSLYAYLANPEEERCLYNNSDTASPTYHSEHDNNFNRDGSVETTMTVLQFHHIPTRPSTDDEKNKNNIATPELLGAITWFPTHGTSLFGNNTLISGDNKGLAALLSEKHYQSNKASPTIPSPQRRRKKPIFGFSQASVGDVSPNILGAWCEDGSGARCSFKNATCPVSGKSQTCHGRGPKFIEDPFGLASCYEIALRQKNALWNALESKEPGRDIKGDGKVGSFHVFHNMSNFEFKRKGNGGKMEKVKTCPAALGHSFAAGTTDGPGAFSFRQNDPEGSQNPIWKVIRNLIVTPSAEQIACQAPKPILLDVGEATRPYAWSPNIVDIQTMRIGDFVIIVSSGEASTMAGRRWKRAVKENISKYTGRPPYVVLGGPANSYTHYITTEQEYAIQRYEGASTLYGPHTLAAHIDRTLHHLPLLFHSRHRPSAILGPSPPDNRNASYDFTPRNPLTTTIPLHHIGSVTRDVTQAVYAPGSIVSASFVGANPRNNLRHDGTFAAVEKLEYGDWWMTVKLGNGGALTKVDKSGDSKKWTTVADDNDWETEIHWEEKSFRRIEAQVVWRVPEEQEGGRYRLVYNGDFKNVFGEVYPFVGHSGEFEVVR